jgi:hypothetical protein
VTDAETGRLDQTDLARGLKAAGIEAGGEVVAALAAEATDHAGRVRLEERERAELAALGRPTYELPMVTGPVDLSDLYAMADELVAAGMV